MEPAPWSKRSHDVVVIGAGVAGLSAAAALRRAGHSVLVLEARERIGGRILTEHDGHGAPIELGAEFVHGSPPELLGALDAAGAMVCEVREEHREAARGRVQRRPDFESALGAFERFAARRASRDTTIAETLAAFGKDRRHRPAVPLIEGYVQGFHAADPRRFGTRAFVAAERAGGEALHRVLSGYDALPRWLAASLDPTRDAVISGAMVHRVRWKPGRVEVRARTSSGHEMPFVYATCAVLSVPVAILRLPAGEPSSIVFEPPLPPAKRRAARAIETGHVLRVVLRFHDRFWDGDPRLRGTSFLHAPRAAIPTWWTSAPARTNVWVGWVGGPPAERLGARGARAWRDEALAGLGAAIGIAPEALEARLRSLRVHDWSADPFARGAYTYLPPDDVEAPRELARAVHQTLFFAGEATETSHEHATVHGALRTGLRAAAEASKALRTR